MSSLDGLDEVLTQIGWGPWNAIYLTTSLLVPACLPVFLIGAEFLNPEPVFTCDVPDDDYHMPDNGSECVMKELTEEGGWETVPCTSWTYDRSVFTSTIAMTWDLVCERQALSPLFQIIYTVGCFIGAAFGGVSANRYGRRWAVRVGAVGSVVGTVLLTSTPWLYPALALRLLLGVFSTLTIYPAFLLTMEMCVPNKRSTVGVLLALPYALMLVGLSCLAYFIRDWRTLQAVASFPCALLLPFVFLVDESPRWLLVQGRVKEAVAVLERGALLNKVLLPDTVTLVHTLTQRFKNPGVSSVCKRFEENVDVKSSQTAATGEGGDKYVAVLNITDATKLDNSQPSGSTEEHSLRNYGSITPDSYHQPAGDEDGQGSWWAGGLILVSCPEMRRLMAVLLAMWYLQAIVYLGLPLGSSFFSSEFLYIALLGLMEVPAYSVAAPITQRLGRRVVVIFCLCTCGLLLMIIFGIQMAGVHNEWLDLTLVMMSYLFVCISYQVNFLYAPELLPTTIRPWGTSCCILIAYVGFSTPPFITDYLAKDQPLIPIVIYGFCGVVAGSLALLLPETNGKPLLETMAEFRERMATERLMMKSKDSKATIASSLRG